MTNLELIAKAEQERLAMIIAANKAGDKAAYERAKASYVNGAGEIIFPEKETVSVSETLETKISKLEFDLVREENMTFLPKDFYAKQDKLYALKKQREALTSQEN